MLAEFKTQAFGSHEVDIKQGTRDRVLVAIPTLNEIGNLPSLLDRIAEHLPRSDVLVIDDDSPDGTGSYASRRAEWDEGLRVLIRRGESGFGSALRDGTEHAIQECYDFLLCLDADFSHDAADLPRLLKAAKETESPADVVIGSRYVAGGRTLGWPLRRRAMSWLVNRFATRVLKLPVRDCSGGLRCYRIEALRKLDLSSLQSKGYSIQEELLLRLREKGVAMKEIPNTFVERKCGRSKLSFRESLRSARQLIRLAAWRSRSRQ